MLSAVFPQLGNSRFVRTVDAFFRSVPYLCIVAALMLAAELFSWELPVYYLYFVFAAVCLLFADDALGVLPVILCCYMTVSPENNPEHFPEQTAFFDPAFFTQVAFLAAAAVILLVGRLAVFCIFSKKRGFPRLSVGFAALGIAYVLGGAFSPFYTSGAILFGLLEIFSLCVMYFYFFYAVDWERAKRWYVPAVFLVIGVALLGQIADMYTQPDVFVNGTVNRYALFTGWATYNNLGCVVCMCIPAACYFSVRSRHGWAFVILECLFALGLLFTQSRGSIMFGFVVFIACMLVSVFGKKGLARMKNLVVFALALFFFSGMFYVLRDYVDVLFESVFSVGLDSNGRFEIWKTCIATFREWPLFGAGFYGTRGELISEGFAFPSFAHNTYVQLLSTGGVFAFLMYLLHRAETCIVLFRRPNAEKVFAALVILAMILTSFVDVHFFSIGPGLMYGAILAAAERSDPAPPARLKAKKRNK